jgi:hypothetical protein
MGRYSMCRHLLRNADSLIIFRFDLFWSSATNAQSENNKLEMIGIHIFIKWCKVYCCIFNFGTWYLVFNASLPEKSEI